MYYTYQEHLESMIDVSLIQCCEKNFLKKLLLNLNLDLVKSKLKSDLDSFANRDPAAKNINNILWGYNSFQAVLHYRIAHEVIELESKQLFQDNLCYQHALSISSKGKMMSGAEIHPSSIIGDNFVLDHGVGTVIGETSEIGSNAYILGGVILGARGISKNPLGRRHPKIGKNVEIGAFSRIFGDINIGDNVFIGPNVSITDDVESGTRIYLKTENIVIK